MDAVTFFGNKRGRKIHQEQHDLRTVFILSTQMTEKSVQLFEANFVARRNNFLGYFPDRLFVARCVCAFRFSCFKGRILVENAWNGHQTIVWEDFWLFSTNNGCLR